MRIHSHLSFKREHTKAILKLNKNEIAYLKREGIPFENGIEFNDFRIGATYDINNSRLKTASQQMGGIEFSLIYTRRPRTDKHIICPKF